MKDLDNARLGAALAAIILGFMGLAGWFFGLEALKSLFPGWVTIKANSAVLLAACGAALLLLRAGKEDPRYELKRNSAYFLAFAAALAGFLTLLEYMFGFNFGLDQFLFDEAADAAYTAAPGRMPLTTSAAFLLTGLGILLANLRAGRRALGTAEKLGLAVLLVAFHSLLCYFFGAFSGTLSNRVTPMAPQTAAAFFFLGIGLILARPGSLVSILSGRGIARTLAVWTLPAAFIVPAIFSGLRLLGESFGLYDVFTGVALTSMFSTAALVCVILYAVMIIQKLDEDMLLTQFSVDNAADAAFWTGPDGRFSYANRAAGALLGYTREELVGMHATEISSLYKTGSWAAHWSALKNEKKMQYTADFLAKDGRLIPVEVSSGYLINDHREYECVFARDLTERRRSTEALRASEARMTAISESANDAILMMTPAGLVSYWNPAAAVMFGYAKEEAIGRDLRGLLIPESSGTAQAAGTFEFGSQGKDRRTRLELKAVRKNGEEFDISISTSGVRMGEEWHTVGIVRDITERNRHEAELRQAKISAEAANRAKRIFLSKMSHEIRTPMNAILGFAQLMRRDQFVTPAQCQNLDIINRSGEHLLDLINEVLEISRIESGRLTLNKEAFALHAMLEDLQKLFKARADARGLRMELEIDASAPRFVAGDQAKLRQILSNLVGNAVKFTQRGGVAVRVRAEDQGEGRLRLEAEVQDSGPGMTAEEIAGLFRPFEQTQSGRSEGSGTGLGLAISREYAQLMGGSVTASSRHGEGSIFTVRVMVEIAGKEEVAGAPGHQRIKMLKPGQPRCRVLITDDKEDNRIFLTGLLGMTGFETRTAESGTQALREFEAWLPHIVLMDLRMPGMDGYEAIKRLRGSEKGKETCIIAVSASAFSDVQREVRDCGADEFISKPFREAELFEKIGKLAGVQYVYEDPAGAAPSGSETLAPGLFAGCPRPLLEKIREAAFNCDFDAIAGLAEEVETVNLEAARGLRSLAQTYDSKGILETVSVGAPE